MGRLTVEEILRGKKPKKEKGKKGEAAPAPPAPSPTPGPGNTDARRAIKRAELKKQAPLSVSEKNELRVLFEDFVKWSERAGKIFGSIGDSRLRAFMAENGPFVLFGVVSIAEKARKLLGLVPDKESEGAMVSICSFTPDPDVVDEQDVPPLTTPNFEMSSFLRFISLCISSLRKIHGPAAVGPITSIQLHTAFELFALERMREEITSEIMSKLSGPLGKAIKDKLVPIILGKDGKLEVTE